MSSGADTAEENQPDLEQGLNRPTTNRSDAPYTIYTKKQKIWIILAASTASFFSPMGSNSYVPALNSIARDLHVSDSLITLTLTTYLIFQGIAPTFIGGFSDSAGRRPAYIIGLVIYVGANIGLALVPNYAALLVFRCFQAAGSSATVALANAVAADIITSAERGEYVAYTSVGAILAPSLAPIIGGILSQYAGWRWIFWFLLIFAMAFFIPFLMVFPETCRKIVGDGSIPPPKLNHNVITALRERRLKKEGQQEFFAERDRRSRERHLTFPNPISTLSIIFSKTAGLALLGNGVLFCCYYAITSSLPSQFRLNYGLDDLHVAFIFLPFAGGGLLSAFTTGRLIDWNYRRHAKRLGLSVDKKKQIDMADFPIEQARMEVAVPLVLVGAAGLLCYGWLVAEGIHIAGPCVFLFMVGYAITGGFNCMAILLVDMYPGKAATATAANNLVRCLMGAGAAAAVVPLAERIGFGWTVTVAAGIWISFTPLLIVISIYGPTWRREAREKKEREEAKQRKHSATEDEISADVDVSETPHKEEREVQKVDVTKI